MDNGTPQLNNYWFFMSYSSRDNDENLREFWLTLAEEIPKHTNLSLSKEPEKIGFRDKKEIYTGDDWRITLSKALQTSKVLLCLYSINYFASKYCGKEVQVFLNRVKSYSKTLKEGADEPKLIIPILWGPPKGYRDSIPQSIKDIQCDDEGLGKLYIEKGLYFLMRVKSQENVIAYNEFVIAMAQRIVKEVKAHQMEHLIPFPSIEEVNSAFHVHATPPVMASSLPAAHLPKTATVPAAKGPEAAWFVYVAGREADYVNVRDNRDCYGKQGGHDWKPYYPHEDKIGIIATNIASTNRFQPETLLISEQLVEHLRVAEENNTPVVLLIDPWIMRLESYTKPINELDRNRLATSVVLVVWNESDQETNKEAQTLRVKLEEVFIRSRDSKEIFRDSICSSEDLKKEIGAKLEFIRNKIMKNPIPKLPVDTNAGSIPILKVPESGNSLNEASVDKILAGSESPASAPSGGDQ